MKGALLVLAMLLLAAGVTFAFGTLALWTAGGGNLGWTKTYIEIQKTDEITGITYPERVNRFVPGVDFLVPGLGASSICILGGLVIFWRRTKLKSP